MAYPLKLDRRAAQTRTNALAAALNAKACGGARKPLAVLAAAVMSGDNGASVFDITKLTTKASIASKNWRRTPAIGRPGHILRLPSCCFSSSPYYTIYKPIIAPADALVLLRSPWVQNTRRLFGRRQIDGFGESPALTPPKFNLMWLDLDQDIPFVQQCLQALELRLRIFTRECASRTLQCPLASE